MSKLPTAFFVAAISFCVGSPAFAQTAAPSQDSPVTRAKAAFAALAEDAVAATSDVILKLRPVTHFGMAKQIFVHGATDLAAYGRHVQTPAALGPVVKTDHFALNAEMKSGYFLTNRFAAGLVGAAAFSNNMLAQGGQLHVGPFVAVNVPIAYHVSFFPSLLGMYGYSNIINKRAGSSAFGHDIEVELQLTALLHVTEHYSVSVSPFVNQVVYARVGAGASKEIHREQGAWVTTYGAKFGLLFWR